MLRLPSHFVRLRMVNILYSKSAFDLALKVSVKIKKHMDEAIWIRIAWGENFSRPNHLKPTYVVHHLQTPYVFVTGLTSKQKPLLSQVRNELYMWFLIVLWWLSFHSSLKSNLLFQALVLSTRYQAIKDANLSGRKLSAIRDLLMRQYQQVGLI